MPTVVGQNCDIDGYVFDPSLDYVKQQYKEIGAAAYVTDRIRHIIGGFRTVKIPAANMLTLFSSPVQLVPAPGAGLIVVPSLLVATMVYGSTTYATNAGGASLNYGPLGAGTAAGFTITQGFLQSASGTNTIVLRGTTTAFLPTTADFNAPLTLLASTSDPTTGNSDMYVRVYFDVISVPFALNQVP